MILIPDVKRKNVGVFGLGVSGIATCEALVASGARVYSFDENREARDKTSDTEYRCEHPKNWPWKEMDFLVVSPGVPLTHPKPHTIVRKARMENVPVIGDTELFARALNKLDKRARPRIVGVTGSNGKSTTTALIGHILKQAGEDVYVGGNIGEAVLSLPAFASDAIYVLELSSFQLDLTETLRLDAAVFLNLSPDHIERHGDVAGYLRSKKRIFTNQTKEDLAVIGVDDDYAQSVCTELMARDAAEVLPVSSGSALGRGVYALDGKFYCNLDGKTLLAGDLENARSLRGPHNWQNAAAAIAVCEKFGVPPALAVKSAQRFEGLSHRLEDVGRNGKVLYINDSKATNADATARALAAFDNIFWIAGGKPKEGGVESLKPMMDRVHSVYLIGEAAAQFEEQLRGSVHCVLCGDLEKAVAAASADALKSDKANPVVLLSPACASYDQFKSFVERGDKFRDLVADLSSTNGEAA
ncbi:UDP-N-acetylmuramoyl-L-alanine--D-glutamate ligase [Hyphococcus flavus]|uniref:UDP-N-acetylmuramoylalanine--D-glutamate ligase n=1 Tax=Hyphococcus flavus TaxID=1866326 RepID=A0AAE9ZDA9_9PROT|nr:UDP-N-acetylmuramoyl-L-alanine--D-glutamate ligase [Hyphococcus flavus]WDI30392.1 UDP-N-acetylmuramoyl-L-alanine--D-glutamate ligase [Hyphococcus flavus]